MTPLISCLCLKPLNDSEKEVPEGQQCCSQREQGGAQCTVPEGAARYYDNRHFNMQPKDISRATVRMKAVQ